MGLSAQKISGNNLPTISYIYTTRCRRAANIMNSHPTHRLFTLLPQVGGCAVSVPGQYLTKATSYHRTPPCAIHMHCHFTFNTMSVNVWIFNIIFHVICAFYIISAINYSCPQVQVFIAVWMCQFFISSMYEWVCLLAIIPQCPIFFRVHVPDVLV